MDAILNLSGTEVMRGGVPPHKTQPKDVIVSNEGYYVLTSFTEMSSHTLYVVHIVIFKHHMLPENYVKIWDFCYCEFKTTNFKLSHTL